MLGAAAAFAERDILQVEAFEAVAAHWATSTIKHSTVADKRHACPVEG
ncbi:MAG: hypothetical protein JJ913_00330 [Rhizobiaceae bacterium]|nr:hypothetical protein [Rhizobiaceae bacterium]